MKKQALLAALILFLAVLLGGLAYVACYRAVVVPECCRNHPMAKDMVWLQHEYHLSSDQLERIQLLHADHARQCMEKCQRIAAQRARLAATIQETREISPAVTEAIKTTSALEWECRQATIAYIYSVAAVMSPEEGHRYIAAMSSEMLLPGTKEKAGACNRGCDMSHSQ